MSVDWVQALEGRAHLSGTVRTAPLFTLISDPFTTGQTVRVVDGRARYANQLLDVRRAHKKTTAVADATGRANIDAAGTLTLTGSRGDDVFKVFGTGRRIEVTLNTGSSTQEYVGNFDAKVVKFVRVEGGRGNDTLTTNAQMQSATLGSGIESRRLSTEPLLTSTLAYNPADAAPGVYRGSTDEWIKRAAGQLVDNDNRVGSTVLLGDSMTERWFKTGNASFQKAFGTDVSNSGLAGDTTSQVLYRLQSGQIAGDKRDDVKLCVINVGTNNTTISNDSAAIFAGIRAVLGNARAHMPNAKFLITGILPQHTSAETDTTIAKVNELINSLAKPGKVYVLTNVTAFQGKAAFKRYYLPGSIHLNAAGYEKWASLLHATVSQLLA